MRREDAVFRRQERIVRPNRLCIDYIQSRGCQLAAVQRICNVLLHDQLSAGVVKENRAALHFCDRFFIDKSRVFGRQVAVERHHIRLRKQGIQINILADGMAGIVGIDIVCQNAHAHRLCDSAQ